LTIHFVTAGVLEDALQASLLVPFFSEDSLDVCPG
jgi:hypothetical protein